MATTSDQSPDQDNKISIGGVHTEGGDFVGQDKVGVDKVGGDKVGGNKVEANTYIEHATYITPSAKEYEQDQTSSPPKVPDKRSHFPRKLFEVLIGIVSMIACIAAAMLVPEVRRFVVLDGSSFEYVVRVHNSDTGDVVQNARVIIEAAGSTSLIGYTDSNGYARISIPNGYQDKPARLIIELGGYQTQRTEINLNADQLPAMMFLKPELAPGTVKEPETPVAVLEPTLPVPISTTSPIISETPTSSPTLDLPIRTAAPSTDISPIDGMALVNIPSGEFLRGLSDMDWQKIKSICKSCQADGLDDAYPQRTIYLDEYQIDRTEITNAQFEVFVEKTGWVTTAEANGYSYVLYKGQDTFSEVTGANWRYPTGPGASITGKGEFPVTQISWNDANAYCKWAKRRLPTEAEWEKAARGLEGWIFPWGDEEPSNTLLNYNFVNDGPVRVGSYPAGASPYGVFDMAGNLWEWVADFYNETYYKGAPDINPKGPVSGEGRVLRGGSWASKLLAGELVFITPIYRLWNKPDMSSNVLGFRCAQSP